MAEESIYLLITQEKSESSGYGQGNTSQRKFSFPGNGSPILPDIDTADRLLLQVVWCICLCLRVEHNKTLSRHKDKEHPLILAMISTIQGEILLANQVPEAAKKRLSHVISELQLVLVTIFANMVKNKLSRRRKFVLGGKKKNRKSSI